MKSNYSCKPAVQPTALQKLQEEETNEQKPPRVRQTANGKLAPETSTEQWNEQFCRSSGTRSTELAERFYAQTLAATVSPGQLNQDQANACLAFVSENPPSDQFEAALRTEMLCVHEHILGLFQKAISAPAGSEHYLQLATKLAKLYISQLIALSKYQRKGTQKVVVERVTVQAGGQAVVGCIERGDHEKCETTITAAEKRTPGGQPGNRNAVRHGWWSAENIEYRREVKALIKSAAETLAAIPNQSREEGTNG